MTRAHDESSQSWVAGVDGAGDAWLVVLHEIERNSIRYRTVDRFSELFDLPEAPIAVGVDMVIGCPDRAEPGGRRCDRRARALLGHPRSACVFSPPAYKALEASTYEDAQRRNRESGPEAPGLTKQAFHLFPKMRAVARTMTPARQEWVREVHPELAFFAMNGDVAVQESKHTGAGREVRLALLEANGFEQVRTAVEAGTGGSVTADDVIDAHAACWTARRICDGTAERCPPVDEPVRRNGRALRMEIWR